MKKTLIALALATVAAPTFAAPIEKTHTESFKFGRDVDHQCGVDIKSNNNFGKLLVTGEGVEPHRAPRFELVNNKAGYAPGTKTEVEISIESNDKITNVVNAPKYDVFLAPQAGFDASQPIVDVEGDKAPVNVQNGLEWKKQYRAQLRLQLTDDQKTKFTEGDKLEATLKLKIDC